MRKNLFHVFVFCVTCCSVFGQSDTLAKKSWKQEEFQSGIVAEVAYQKLPFVSLGAMVGQGFGKMDRTIVGGGVALDILYDGSNSAFGPRIFLAVHVPNSIGVRVGVADYRKENSDLDDFRFLTEVSYSLGGLIGLNAGLSFPIGKDYHSNIGSFRVGMTVNLMR